jgi:uncharacterized protein (TIGR01777 family)
MRVLVTGATGFVGKRVVKQLLAAGDEVVVLTRYIPKAILTLGKNCRYYSWPDTSHPAPSEAFEGVDAVINLMGEGIAEKRWSDDQKKRIYNSRILGTKMLIEGMRSLAMKPKVFVSASAVGIYGNRGNEEITEDSSTVSDFLGLVCKDWESEALKARDLGARVALIRTGVVLGKDGGALSKMLPIFKLGAGGPVGKGNQYMSWIHVEDIAAMYVEAAKNPSIEGVYNGTAPFPVTSKEFAKVMGKVLRRPAFAPAPSLALKLVFGEMSQVLLDGQKVLPEKFKQGQFRFRFPNLELALKEELQK